MIALILIPLLSNSQIDTSKTLVPNNVIREISKDLARYDGLLIVDSLNTIAIKEFQLDLSFCEGQLQLLQEGKTDCETLQAKKDETIVEQDGKIHKVKMQRNVLGGSALLFLLVIVLL